MNNKSELSRYDFETLKNVLNNAFPEELFENHSCIAHEIISLSQLLSHQYKIDFPELETIISLAQGKISSIKTPLDQHKNQLTLIYQGLVRNKQIEKYYFTAFIVSVMRSPSHDHQQFQHYKAITLLVCAKLYSMGNHESAIKAVCNEIRQWTLGKRNDLANNLPDVIEIDMKSLIKELDLKRKEKFAISKSSRVGNQLSNIYVPYNDSFYYNDGILRKKTLRDPGAQPTTLMINPIELEGIDKDIIQVTELMEVQTHQEGWATEEAASERTKSQLLISIKKASDNGYAVQKLQAQAIGNQIKKNNMLLPCCINQATKFEIQTLLSYCMSTSNVRDKTRSFLLASLTLGASFERISRLNYIDNCLAIEHTLPTQKQRRAIIQLITPTKAHFTLKLPYNITANLLNDLDDSTIERVAKLLSFINKQYGTRLTTTKISSYLRFLLKQESIDPTIIALIHGETAKTTPELSYTHLSDLDVQRTYDRFISYLENLCSKSTKIQFKRQVNVEIEGKIGSPLLMSDENLSIFFKTLKMNITSRDKKYSQQHNLVTYYVLFTIGISSGYRPVTGWLGKITDYNLLNLTLWISDKEMLQSQMGRLIILPEIAVRILKQYIQFLKAGIVDSMKLNADISARYRQAITGEQHLFFFINNNRSIEEVTPSTMTAHFDNVLPLPLNWHRHYIRSLLFKEKLHPDLIAAWMGHAQLNEPAFTRFSSYSISDLKIISDLISQKLTSVNCMEINFVKTNW